MSDKPLHGLRVKHEDSVSHRIQSAGSSVIGLVATADDKAIEFPLNTPVLVTKRSQFKKLNATGTLRQSLEGIYAQAAIKVVVVRVTEDTVKQGIQALLGAESEVNVQPRILIAPGFSQEKDVAESMHLVAKRLSAFALLDAPHAENTKEEAIAYAKNFTDLERLEVLSPWVKGKFLVPDEKAMEQNAQKSTQGAVKQTVEGQEKILYKEVIKFVPSSPYHAGVMAKTHSQKGFWWSNSNQPMLGVIGLERPIDYKIDDVGSEANELNQDKVTTIIRQGGYRSWGNRTTNNKFKNVVITNDMIADSLTRAHQWALDRNITKTYMEDVVENVNNYLRHLTQIGAIAGGRCWADPETNTADQISDGKVCFDYEFSTFSPAESITFISRMTKTFLKEII